MSYTMPLLLVAMPTGPSAVLGPFRSKAGRQRQQQMTGTVSLADQANSPFLPTVSRLYSRSVLTTITLFPASVVPSTYAFDGNRSVANQITVATTSLRNELHTRRLASAPSRTRSHRQS